MSSSQIRAEAGIERMSVSPWWALVAGACGASLVALTVAAQIYLSMLQHGHSFVRIALVRASLTSFEERLAPEIFVRTHRMAIVNLTHVRETQERDGLRLVLSEGTQVGVSRSRRSHVESLLAPRLR